jgi:hypothetical protein
LIVEFFAINVAILNTIVIYFVAGPKIENFIKVRLKLKKYPQSIKEN